MPDKASGDEVLFLLHGIRTRATWQSEIQPALEAPGRIVKSLKYSYFDAFRFLVPLESFRRPPVERVVAAYRMMRNSHPHSQVSIVAHSFGSYIVSRILEREDCFDIKFKYIVLCGSIIDENFKWELYSHRYEKVVNDFSNSDIWPLLASSSSWGYGASGKYGFGHPCVDDRRHYAFRHSDFLKEKFARKFWRPLFDAAKVVASNPGKVATNRADWLLSVLKLKYVALGLVVFGLLVAFHVLSDERSVRSTLATADIQFIGPEKVLFRPLAEPPPDTSLPSAPDDWVRSPLTIVAKVAYSYRGPKSEKVHLVNEQLHLRLGSIESVYSWKYVVEILSDGPCKSGWLCVEHNVQPEELQPGKISIPRETMYLLNDQSKSMSWKDFVDLVLSRDGPAKAKVTLEASVNLASQEPSASFVISRECYIDVALYRERFFIGFTPGKNPRPTFWEASCEDQAAISPTAK